MISARICGGWFRGVSLLSFESAPGSRVSSALDTMLKQQWVIWGGFSISTAFGGCYGVSVAFPGVGIFPGDPIHVNNPGRGARVSPWLRENDTRCSSKGCDQHFGTRWCFGGHRAQENTARMEALHSRVWSFLEGDLKARVYSIELPVLDFYLCALVL